MNPVPAERQGEAELPLGAAAIEALAVRVAELLAGQLQPQHAPRQMTSPGRLLSAAEVSRWWGVSRGWVYQHAEELGAIRIGNGDRPRLRFDPDRVAEHLDRPGPQPPPTPAPKARNVRRSPRIRGDHRRLAFRCASELSSPETRR